MVLEDELIPFLTWLPTAWSRWWQVVLVLALVAGAVAFFLSLVRHGPLTGTRYFVVGLWGALADIVRISPRRVWALSRLAFQEALHRKVLVAFGVFMLVMLFASWYLDPTSNDPARLYLSFVLTATTYLSLLLALFLSVFSLPADIHHRTIYTVVTKPVRPSEIILGRMVGFSLIGTGLLLVTGLTSYLFVVRGLSHTHEFVPVAAATETDADDPSASDAADAADGAATGTPTSAMRSGGYERAGTTSTAGNHRHEVFLDEAGNGYTSLVNGHRHPVEAIDRNGRREYVVGSHEGLLVARVPIYGKLTFRDRQGNPAAEGINVGKEWTYRSYVEGGTLATAVWRFSGLDSSRFGDTLPLEMNIRVFRTHKGNIKRTVLGSIVLRNPETGVASSPRVFHAREFYSDLQNISRKLTDNSPEGRPLDLFDDLVSDGQLDVELRCLEPGQFFGMAQADVYLRAREAPFWLNFVKGYVGIWLQMLLVTGLGVMFSTFLNGAVAMMATMATLIAGFFTRFIQQLASGELPGGGPLESLVRLWQQKNLVAELEPGLTREVVETIDVGFRYVLGRLVLVLPDFPKLSDVDFVAQGFDIPVDLLLEQTFTAAAVLLPVFVVGFLLLKTREVAR